MKLTTVKFGEIEVNDDLIFEFKEPILGYEELKHYTILDCSADSPFKWLQSTENMEIAFPVTIPALFGVSYSFSIPDEQVKQLELEDAEDVLTLNIANIPPGEPEKATVNLLGPLVINVKNRKAIQMILNDGEHSVRHKLFPEDASSDK